MLRGIRTKLGGVDKVAGIIGRHHAGNAPETVLDCERFPVRRPS